MLAAVGVRVALEGREPDLEEWPDCVLQHVFHDVQLGSHEVKVTDAVGFPETLEVLELEARPWAPLPVIPGVREHS